MEEEKRKGERKERGNKEKEKIRKKKQCMGENGKGREGKRRFSRCSEGWSMVRELNFVHATRATHGY